MEGFEPAAFLRTNLFGTKGKRAKTVDNCFCEVRNENNEQEERVYRATLCDYIFGRVTQVQVLSSRIVETCINHRFISFLLALLTSQYKKHRLEVFCTAHLSLRPKRPFFHRLYSLSSATQILKADSCFLSAFCICILTDKLEFVYFLMIVFHHFIIELIDSASPTQHHTEHCAYSCLQDLIRHFEDCIFGCTVNKSSAE